MLRTVIRWTIRLGAVAVVAVVVVAAGSWTPAAQARGLSPGCQELNDPTYDDYYIQKDAVIDEFYPSERVTIKAGPPDSSDEFTPPIEEFQLSVRLTPTGNWKSISVPYPGSISQVLGVDGVPPVAVSWGTFEFVTWEVSCEAGGHISGTVKGDVGDALPIEFEELGLGKVEVWTEFDEFMGTWEANGADGGTFSTDWLPEGQYYVLLYNGDDTGFIDFFPEWYPNTPLYNGTPANLIHVHDGEVRIDAELQLGFLDMWDSVFLDDIAWMQFSGITKGCGNNLYCTDGSVTRGQMAAFMVRALGLTDDGGGDLFDDDNDSIFETDIDKLATAGITKGCNPPVNNRFCPDAKVSRGQMAAFLVRAMGYTNNGGGDLFDDDDGSIFENDIDRLATAGVTRGCNPPDNTNFCPGTYVTRGQMAAFLHRALGGVLYPADASAHNPLTWRFR